MRILVTGAAGFLGSYLVTELVERRHDVAVLLRPGSHPWRLEALGDRIQRECVDLDHRSKLCKSLAELRPEVIAHLAWRGVENVDHNNHVQAHNIPTTMHLLDLAAAAGARVFIGAGSQAEYGPYDRPISELDATHPTTLYGHAKLAAGLMANWLAAKRDLRFAWMRVFSTYGAKDNPSWLIPSLITKMRKNERMSLTAGEQRWGLLHARDAAAGFRTVIENSSASGVFNLGSPNAPLLRDTILRLRDLVNPQAELGFGEVPYRPDQVMVLSADVSRLQALGWAPSIKLEDGLAETVAFYDCRT